MGGGHDHAYSHAAGVLRTYPSGTKMGCINIDAHFDLRPPLPDGKITSGSGFFILVEDGIVAPQHLIEFGIQSHCNQDTLWTYAKAKGIHTLPYKSLRNGKAVREFSKILKKLSTEVDVIIVSLDLDAIQQSDAPGVSAPQAEGFTPSEIFQILEIAATFSKVCSVGVFELNPEHDEGSKTARLAAQAVYHFLEAKLESRKPVSVSDRLPWKRSKRLRQP
jgi:formiminoglutamase